MLGTSMVVIKQQKAILIGNNGGFPMEGRFFLPLSKERDWLHNWLAGEQVGAWGG